MMVMRDDPPRDTPEPFNAVGIRIIGRCINQAEMLFQFGKHATHQQGASRCVGFEIVRNDDGNLPSLLGTGHRASHLLAEDVSSASCGNAAIEPAITPVYQAKAVHFPIIPRCFNQALPTPSFSRPNAREGGVKGHLHLVLQIEIGTRQQGEQAFQVGGKLIPQVRLHQNMNG